MQTTEEALVAIKTCKPGSSPEERAKFLQEAGELIMFANNDSVTDFVVLANFFLLNIAFKCSVIVTNMHHQLPITVCTISLIYGWVVLVYGLLVVLAVGKLCQLCDVYTSFPPTSSSSPFPLVLLCHPILVSAVMRQFSHPHIIKLFGVVTQGVSTFIVMELAPLGQVCVLLCALCHVLMTLIQPKICCINLGHNSME